jgi:hypothetical protein
MERIYWMSMETCASGRFITNLDSCKFYLLRTFCVHSQHISTGLYPFRKGSTNR